MHMQRNYRPLVYLLHPIAYQPPQPEALVVEPFRQKSQFWHNLWVENGRPKTGAVSDIMRKTRAAYHRAVRHVIRNEQDLINDRFASALLNNRSRDFWSEVKRIRRNRTCSSNCVDSAFNPTDIVNVFADKYQELCTADDMVCLKNKIADLVSTVGYNSHCSVNCEQVLFAFCKLKPGKDDGDIGLSSDYFLHACNELSVHIPMLFTCLLVHGVAPQMMNLSTVVPIPKGKNTFVCRIRLTIEELH